MKAVKVRNVVIGEGMPKICVPITGTSMQEILSEARVVKELPADFAEWRADWFDGVFDREQTGYLLKALRDVLGGMPILFTMRTAKEGGAKDIEYDVYADINIGAARTGLTDMVDVEAFTSDEASVKMMIGDLHDAGVKVIASSHDFRGTPDKDEILRRLCVMQDMDADILKIAVMPGSSKDVLTLLEAAEEMTSQHADRPVIAVSMSGIGLPSRLTGEIFGSAVTFGAASRASAPGQIAAGDLRHMLDLIHDAQR